MSKSLTKEKLLKTAKPISFNTEMARAILESQKTQTRRVIKRYGISGYRPKNINDNSKYRFTIEDKKENSIYDTADLSGCFNSYLNTKYKVGDILWVREPVKVTAVNDYQDCFDFKYLADDKEAWLPYLDKWINEEGMIIPKWVENCQGVPNGCLKEMARTFLKVTGVRVERLQDISNTCIINEGVNCPNSTELIEMHKKNNLKKGYILPENVYKIAWINLWNSTAPKGYKWEDNPWVFVYEFEKVEYAA